MRYVVGVRTTEHKDGSSTAVAVTWFNTSPPFSVHGMTLEFMRQRLLAVVRTDSSSPQKAINAALQRTAEKLYVRQLTLNPVNGDPAFSIVIQPKNHKCDIRFPFKTQKKHWLLTGAKRALDAWPERRDG
jgi:hypothetical protein